MSLPQGASSSVGATILEKAFDAKAAKEAMKKRKKSKPKKIILAPNHVIASSDVMANQRNHETALAKGQADNPVVKETSKAVERIR